MFDRDAAALLLIDDLRAEPPFQAARQPCGVPPRPPPDPVCGRVDSLLQRRSGDGHAFSGGYVWLEFITKPVSRVSRKAVVAAVTNDVRARLHTARHTFVVKRQMSTLCVASYQSDSDFGHVASHGVAPCFGKGFLPKLGLCRPGLIESFRYVGKKQLLH